MLLWMGKIFGSILHSAALKKGQSRALFVSPRHQLPVWESQSSLWFNVDRALRCLAHLGDFLPQVWQGAQKRHRGADTKLGYTFVNWEDWYICSAILAIEKSLQLFPLALLITASHFNAGRTMGIARHLGRIPSRTAGSSIRQWYRGLPVHGYANSVNCYCKCEFIQCCWFLITPSLGQFDGLQINVWLENSWSGFILLTCYFNNWWWLWCLRFYRWLLISVILLHQPMELLGDTAFGSNHCWNGQLFRPEYCIWCLWLYPRNEWVLQNFSLTSM